MFIRIIQETILLNKSAGDFKAGGQKAHWETQLAKTVLCYWIKIFRDIAQEPLFLQTHLFILMQPEEKNPRAKQACHGAAM